MVTPLVGKVKSTDSIGVNIAEGNGRYNLQDNQRFVKITRESLNQLAYQRNLLNQQNLDKIKPIIDELSPKLNPYLNSLTNKSITRQQSTVNSQQSTVTHHAKPPLRIYRKNDARGSIKRAGKL